MGRISQQQNTKIQCHFQFLWPLSLSEFEAKTCKTFVRRHYKMSTGKLNYELINQLYINIKFLIHMQGTKLNYQ